MSDNLLNIWRNTCRSHYFDEGLYKAIETGRVKSFCYLSSGQEVVAATIAEAVASLKPAVFAQHRGHAAYISFGGNLEKLRDELLGLPSGCNGGRGGDPFIHDPEIKYFGHDSLVGTQVPIAVGYAYATRQPVVCFCGDATVEEDQFWPSVGFATTHALPVLFVVEDNNLSVITEVDKRRSWSVSMIAHGLVGMTGASWRRDVEIEGTLSCITEWRRRLDGPMLLEIECCRKYRHVGIGNDGPMARDAMEIIGRQLSALGRGSSLNISLTVDADCIQREALNEMERLWA